MSERFADAGAWLCSGDTPACGDETIVQEPAADCFVVHAADDPHLGVGTAADEVPPTADRKQPWPRCVECSRRGCRPQSATAPGDETLDAFRYYAANMNDGRPFVVVARNRHEAVR